MKLVELVEKIGDFDVYRGQVPGNLSHGGHTVEIWIALHPCGVSQIDVWCSCGSKYLNRMSGCYLHNRFEEGDPKVAIP